MRLRCLSLLNAYFLILGIAVTGAPSESLRRYERLPHFFKPQSKAEPIVQSVITADPGKSDAQILLGIIFEQRRQFRAAEE